MNLLVDTNVLLRLVQRDHLLHPSARSAILQLRQQKHSLYVVSQNCVEFWNVATRPANRNGLGLSITFAEYRLRLVERLFVRLPDRPSVYDTWRRIVNQYDVSGVQVHDARLVAAMKENDLTHILTFNLQDFLRFTPKQIVVVDPQTFL